MIKKGITILLCLGFIVSNAQENRLTPERLWQFNRLSDQQVSPDGEWVLFGLTAYNLEENKGKRSLYIIPAQGGEMRKVVDLDASAYNARWRPDGKKIGFLTTVSGNMQLWEVNPDGSELAQVTNYEQPIANFAYAPDQRHISFTMDIKLDSTVNEMYPDLPHANARIIDDLMYRHWDEWHDFRYSHAMIAEYNDGQVSGEPTDIMEGEKYDAPLKPFGGPEDIVWAPDGQKLAYVCKKQTGKEYALGTDSDIYLYNLQDKTTTNLTEGMDGYDTHPVFSGSGSLLAWLNMERPGFEADRNVIYIRDMATGEKKSITGDLDASVSNFTWAPDDQSIYFIAGVDATYQIYRVNLKSDRFSRINPSASAIRTVTEGWHNYYELGMAGESLVGTKASMSQPNEIFRVDPRTGEETQLSVANQTLLSQLEMGKVEKRMVKTTDNQEMLVWVIYPPDFDPAKKYPTLLYCQGGPQSAVSQFFSYRWNFQLMAANGYIIVAPNRRGLPTFGQEWNDQISGDWGGQAMQDYLAAIDSVAKEPFVDEERLGAVGASFGGYSVYYLAGIHEGRFKTFISHCGLFNLESWYGSTEEMFFANWDLGGPYWMQPEPESYDRFSPHDFAGAWDTPILVIHNQKDFRVPVTQGMEAFSAAQLQDIPSRFLYFPEEGHWVLGAQNGVLWHRVFFDWLDRYLK